MLDLLGIIGKGNETDGDEKPGVGFNSAFDELLVTSSSNSDEWEEKASVVCLLAWSSLATAIIVYGR